MAVSWFWQLYGCIVTDDWIVLVCRNYTLKNWGIIGFHVGSLFSNGSKNKKFFVLICGVWGNLPSMDPALTQRKSKFFKWPVSPSTIYPLSSTWTSSLTNSLLMHFTPAIQVFLFFLKPISHTLTLRPLPWLFPLGTTWEMHFPQNSTWPPYLQDWFKCHLSSGAYQNHFTAKDKPLLCDNLEGRSGEAGRRGFRMEGAHIHPRPIHTDVWQKPPQCCKVTILQLK